MLASSIKCGDKQVSGSHRVPQSFFRFFPALFFSVCMLSCGGGSSGCASGSSCGGASYTIGGTVSGLGVGTSVVLRDNGSDSTTVSADGSFTFATAVAAGGSFAVTVGTQTLGQTCTVSNGAGSNVSANVSSVVVSCVASSVNVLASLSPAFGTSPYSGLIQASDGNFYGFTNDGGANNGGTVFRVTPGGALSLLLSLDSASSGTAPRGAPLQAADGNLYGTAFADGSIGNGTAFKISTAGAFVLLHDFVGYPSGGSGPRSTLIQASNGDFYGTTSFGGSVGSGTVFRMTSSGALTVLKNFSASEVPYGALLEATDGFLYGTFADGVTDTGGVYKINLDGSSYSEVHSFVGASEGAHTYAPLIQATDGNFYGTLNSDGSGGSGAVFRMTPAGVVTILHAFAGGAADGASPDQSGVLQASDGNLYGVTYYGGAFSGGGAFGGGVLYRLTLAGTFTLLHSFGGGADGDRPEGQLIQGTDGKLYGVTRNGGSSGDGAVFVY